MTPAHPTPAQFFAAQAPAAQAAAKQTGWLPSTILAVAAIESGYGTSWLAQHNNLWGIKYAAGATTGGGTANPYGPMAVYPTQQGGWQDFVRVAQLPEYKGVVAATTSGAQVRALAASSYNTSSHYHGGVDLTRVISSFDLTKYDTAPAAQAPAEAANPAPAQTAADASPQELASQGGYTVSKGAGGLTIAGPGLTGGGGAVAILAVMGALIAALALL